MGGDLLLILGLALLPPAGNFAGGLIAEYRKPSARLLNWALHAASGIVIAIVGIELLPRALGGLAGWWIAAAFAAGALPIWRSSPSSSGCRTAVAEMAKAAAPGCG